MRIDTVNFVASYVDVKACPPGRMPEIAASGRSNVGKSSLLNTLCGRRKLVQVSGTPGKTQMLNFFLVNERFHLVDLPGYGFAKAPYDVRARWGRMMQGYLRTREQLMGVIQLVDARHEPSKEDREMVEWLRDERVPFVLVATKIDKIGTSKWRPTLEGLVRTLELKPTQPVIAWSSETGEGRPALLAWLTQAIAPKA